MVAKTGRDLRVQGYSKFPASQSRLHSENLSLKKLSSLKIRHHSRYSKLTAGDGEMAQRLRVLAPLSEDPGSIPAPTW